MEYYVINIENVSAWKYNETLNSYERSKRTGKLLLEKKDNYCYRNMACNFKDHFSDSGIRIREWEDSIIIEPSGIKLPLSCVEVVDKAEVPYDPEFFDTISRKSYFCDLISDYNINGRNRIMKDEVDRVEREIENGRLVDLNNYPCKYESQDFLSSPYYISPYDFMRVYLLHNYLKKIPFISRAKLLDKLFHCKYDANYMELLQNIPVERGEHYDYSPCIDSSMAVLRYRGYLYPNYSVHNYGEEGYDRIYQYDPMYIDEGVVRFSTLYQKLVKEDRNLEYLLDQIIDLSAQKLESGKEERIKDLVIRYFMQREK